MQGQKITFKPKLL